MLTVEKKTSFGASRRANAGAGRAAVIPVVASPRRSGSLWRLARCVIIDAAFGGRAGWDVTPYCIGPHGVWEMEMLKLYSLSGEGVPPDLIS